MLILASSQVRLFVELSLFIVLTVAYFLFLSGYKTSWTRLLEVKLKKHNEKVDDSVKRLDKISQDFVARQLLFEETLEELLTTVTLQNDSVNKQIELLKGLMKSDVIEARRSELVRTKELKEILDRFISITTLSRRIPEGRDILALESATNRIAELEAILSDLNGEEK